MAPVVTPGFPFVRAYLDLIPGLLIEMHQNKAFAHAIPRLSGGLAKEDDREDEDVVEDMLLLDGNQPRGDIKVSRTGYLSANIISTWAGRVTTLKHE